MMIKRYLGSFFFLFFCVFMVQAQNLRYTLLNQKINQSERDLRQYQVIQLDNQMKVLLISDDNAVKSLASLALPVGSLHDPKSQQGLAHYTEHMVLMGSKNYPEPSSFSQYLSQHAGRYNASTAAYRTAFYFEVENEAFAGALDRLADAIADPLLDEEYADKERNAVNSELTMARSNDGFRIGQIESETINQSHPASQFSGGNLQTLSDKEGSTLQEELEQFYHQYYSANLMVGVVYGNQPMAQLVKLAETTFGRIKNNHVVVPSIAEQAILKNHLAKMIYMQPAQPKKALYIQFPIENNLTSFADKSDEYIGYMINNRSENTLFDQLQKQGLIETIGASADPVRYGNSGVFNFYASLTDQGLENKDDIIAAIFGYLQQLQQTGISQQYYDEIKNVLALDFKYPDITRDMSYVEWLADQMLFYPTEHILDADYIAENFNQQAIKERLASLTIDNARIWVISPNQQTNKTAYFVDAPYKIEDITEQQKMTWLKIAEKKHFTLPILNPYIPTQFSIFQQDAVNNSPQQTFSEQGNHLHFSSQHFADEPKAALVLSLRNNTALTSVEGQVAFNLLDYMINRELAQLRFQASVAGISFSTQADDGLMISVSGFNQHVSEMLKAIFRTYQNIEIDEQTLALAKSWYLEKLDAAEHAKSYALAMQPVNALSSFPYFERNEKRSTLHNISVEQLRQYRDRLLTESVPYMLSFGQLKNEQAIELYSKIKNLLDDKARYQLDDMIKVEKNNQALLTQKATSTDNALLMSFIPKSYDETTARVSSYLLYKIISPWFYDQLRSNEQLGYAVFSLPARVGESSGIGFLIQSNQYDPAYLNKRYQAFYPVILDKLNALSEDEFKQYQLSVLNEMLMPPQTFDEELGQYMGDYYRSKFNFDSKQKRIDKIKLLTKSDVIEFYQKAVIAQEGLVLASQVLGEQQDKNITPVEGLPRYQGASELQKQLLAY